MSVRAVVIEALAWVAIWVAWSVAAMGLTPSLPLSFATMGVLTMGAAAVTTIARWAWKGAGDALWGTLAGLFVSLATAALAASLITLIYDSAAVPVTVRTGHWLSIGLDCAWMLFHAAAFAIVRSRLSQGRAGL